MPMHRIILFQTIQSLSLMYIRLSVLSSLYPVIRIKFYAFLTLDPHCCLGPVGPQYTFTDLWYYMVLLSLVLYFGLDPVGSY